MHAVIHLFQHLVEAPYDIILCSLSLLAALSTEEEFVTKLTKYHKTGGKLLIFHVENPR